VVDYKLLLYGRLYLNDKKRSDPNPAGEFTRYGLLSRGLDPVESCFDKAIEKEMRGFEEFRIKRKVVVKSFSGKAKNLRFDISDFSSDAVEQICEAANTISTYYNEKTVILEFEVKLRFNKLDFVKYMKENATPKATPVKEKEEVPRSRAGKLNE